MCGIAGYSLSPESPVDRTLAAQALLAGIAERGADAVGYAHSGPGAAVSVHKQRTGATAILDRISVPQAATEALVHVRDYTKGHPTIAANNHPIRHGAVVGIHNGIIVNDEELFAQHRFQHAEPEMTVDSEAIFALVDAYGVRAELLEQLHGAMATAWLDERHPDALFLARGIGRPLWIGQARRDSSSPRPGRRSRSSSGRCGCGCASESCPTARSPRSSAAASPHGGASRLICRTSRRTRCRPCAPRTRASPAWSSSP